MRNSFQDRVACSHEARYVRAARAVQAGTASETEQKVFFGWLFNVACRVDETTFWPGDPAATAYLEGRRSIAADVVALIKAKVEEKEV